MAVPDITEILRYINDRKDDLKKELSSKLRYDQLRAENSLKSLQEGMIRFTDDRLALIERLKIVLEENDPRKILIKGYTVIQDQQGNTVGSKDELTDGEYDIVFSDGKIRVRISNV
jgi:exodeoxyribonuclease VII large subunit